MADIRTLALFVAFWGFLLFSGSIIGYTITLVCAISLAGIILFAVLCRSEIKQALSDRVNKYSIVFLLLLIVFFVAFSASLKRTELIFFDEQIYESVAVNIMAHGNALTCIYGTAQLKNCYANTLGFDPNGWPFLVAIAYEISGVSASTAYNLEVSIGALSIIAVFLLTSLLSKRKEIPVISAAVFALIPELFVWSKTLANPNMPFMLFAILTLFFFLIFIEKRTWKTLALSIFSLAFTFYIRIEALLLIPIFFIVFFTFGEKGIADAFGKAKKDILDQKRRRSALPYALLFGILAVPEFLAILITRPELLENAMPFLVSRLGIFSLSYFPRIAYQNLLFLTGQVTVYPIIFLPEISIFAAIGTAYLLFNNKKALKGSLSILLLLLSVFIAYFSFYGMYFSGSALAGGSVRFLLILYPALSILAAFGVYGLSKRVSSLLKSRLYRKWPMPIAHYILCIVFTALFFAVPFFESINFLMHPNYSYPDFPVIPNKSTQIDPYAMSYANKSLAFIDNDYNLIPSDCLVFSPSPYLWYGLNRSSAYVSLYNSSVIGTENYSCYALDYGYFCNSIFNNSACNTIMSRYSLRVLATENSGLGSNFTLYQILNYSRT